LDLLHPALGGCCCGLDMRLRSELRVDRPDELPRFLVGDVVKHLPLVGIERRGRENGRRNRERVASKIFEKPKRQRERSDGSGGGRTQWLIYAPRLIPDGRERLSDSRTATIRASARNQIHQLTPAYRRIVPILGRLVQDGLQTIVKAHWLFVSLGRTLLLLYASVYNALSFLNLTPRNGTHA
jgi:hypothetical protein